MPAFASPLDQLDAVIALVSVLVERQIVAAWLRGELPRPNTFDARDTADPLFARGLETSEQMAARIRELDEQLAQREIALQEGATAATEMPLDRLRSAFDLSATEERVLHIALAAEHSVRVRSLMRFLANDVRRPVLDRALLETLVYGRNGRAQLQTELGPRSPLFERRLLELSSSNESMMFEGIRATARTVELSTGVVRVAPEVQDVLVYVSDPASFDELVVSPELRERLTGLVQPSGFMRKPAVVLAGPQGCGRRALLGAAARAAGKGALFIKSGDLPRDPAVFLPVVRAILREALILDAMPVFVEVETIAEIDAPSRIRERLLDTALDSWRDAVGATAAPAAAQPLKIARGSIVIDVPPLGEAEREKLWRATIGPMARSGLDMAQLAARYPVTAGMLLQAGNAASAVAAARDGIIIEEDIQLGLRSAMDERMSTLGQRIARSQRWEDLVAPPDVMDSLTEFVSRIRYKRRVFDDWGFADKYTKGLGLSALFTGPPGTGKTMAATLIAGQLALDVYQVDVSKLVSKFIGETEKNLAQIFDAAELGQAIVLFDEADALFAKRGEVRSSVDRYANLEVNYLLQRLERFSGIAILTTNLAASIDAAFKRRISFTIEFPLPEAKERERIWKAHLPTQAEVAADIDFKWLSERHVMSGGHIRNAVLRAAFLAAAENTAIQFDHLKRAAQIEAVAMGKVI